LLVFAADAVGGVTICVWPDPQWAQNWMLDTHVENSVLSKRKTEILNVACCCFTKFVRNKVMEMQEL